MIILISADGNGAGKSTLGSKLGEALHLANGIRTELDLNENYRIHDPESDREFEYVDWYLTSTKNAQILHADETPTGKTGREIMIELGQKRCEENPIYWCEELLKDILKYGYGRKEPACICDIRKVYEVEFFRKYFPTLVHFHISSPQANPEPEFENDKLKEIADYVLLRQDDQQLIKKYLASQENKEHS